VKTASYRLHDGSSREIEYDENAPCHWCGLPVVEASMGGTACCPWCDLGQCRFDKSHRVDWNPMNPETGKMYPPSWHYEQFHADRSPRP
jgi:hypothetical protein